MIKDEYRTFLTEKTHTDKIGHSGRSLFDHLAGTHNLLHLWGNEEAVCTAGLFHSIYGTKHFRHKTWPLSDRETIRNLIGHRAETLAYIFCTATRPKVFFEPVGINDLGLRSMMRDLREIEAANLIEQNSQSGWLPRLYTSDISAPAKAAIWHHLQWMKNAGIPRRSRKGDVKAAGDQAELGGVGEA